MSFSFIDNLGFIELRTSVKEIAKILKKASNLIVKQKEKNVVTYNMAKIKLVLFF